MLIVVIGIYLLYVLFLRSPLNLLPTNKSCDSAPAQTSSEEETPGDPDSLFPEASDSKGYDFDGPIRFPRLSKSLYNIEKKFGEKEDNNHVLFTAASLTGISELIPLACDMASEKTNIVHFGIMGRHDIPMGTLLRVNGVGATDCPVYWHGTRII